MHLKIFNTFYIKSVYENFYRQITIGFANLYKPDVTRKRRCFSGKIVMMIFKHGDYVFNFLVYFLTGWKFVLILKMNFPPIKLYYNIISRFYSPYNFSRCLCLFLYKN